MGSVVGSAVVVVDVTVVFVFEEADEAASAAVFSAAAVLSGFAAADNAAIEAPDKSRTDTAAARVFFIIIVHLTISNAE